MNNQNSQAALNATKNDTVLAVSTGPAPAPASGPEPGPFDAGRYWSYLDGIDASDDQKAALLEALWSIMAGFVQLGFGVDPVQAVLPALIDAARREDDAAQDIDSAALPFQAASRPSKEGQE